jgi:hypothetical protein
VNTASLPDLREIGPLEDSNDLKYADTLVLSSSASGLLVTAPAGLGYVGIWSLQTLKQVGRIDTDDASLLAADWAQDLLFTSCSLSSNIAVWQLSTCTELHSFQPSCLVYKLHFDAHRSRLIVRSEMAASQSAVYRIARTSGSSGNRSSDGKQEGPAHNVGSFADVDTHELHLGRQRIVLPHLDSESQSLDLLSAENYAQIAAIPLPRSRSMVKPAAATPLRISFRCELQETIVTLDFAANLDD